MTGKPFGECNCLAIRQAARHVTQLYDQMLAASGLRATQYSILNHLDRYGGMTINALAAALVVDRTALGRNLRPLERDGLIEIATTDADRRRRLLRLTQAGSARLAAARHGWRAAQTRFEAAFGADRARELRGLLHEVAASDLAAGSD